MMVVILLPADQLIMGQCGPRMMVIMMTMLMVMMATTTANSNHDNAKHNTC